MILILMRMGAIRDLGVVLTVADVGGIPLPSRYVAAASAQNARHRRAVIARLSLMNADGLVSRRKMLMRVFVYAKFSINLIGACFALVLVFGGLLLLLLLLLTSLHGLRRLADVALLRLLLHVANRCIAIFLLLVLAVARILRRNQVRAVIGKDHALTIAAWIVNLTISRLLIIRIGAPIDDISDRMIDVAIHVMDKYLGRRA